MVEKRVLKPPIGQAIERLLPPPIRSAELVDLFDSRASYANIQAWRYGSHKPPQWALDIIDAKLAAAIEPIQECREAVRREGPGPGQGWDKRALTLLGWRARQELEKERGPD